MHVNMIWALVQGNLKARTLGS